MKKNATAKIFATIALFGIIIGIIGTALLFILQGGATVSQPIEELTEEEIQKVIEESGLNLGETGSSVEALDSEILDATLEPIDSEEVLIQE